MYSPQDQHRNDNTNCTLVTCTRTAPLPVLEAKFKGKALGKGLSNSTQHLLLTHHFTSGVFPSCQKQPGEETEGALDFALEIQCLTPYGDFHPNGAGTSPTILFSPLSSCCQQDLCE